MFKKTAFTVYPAKDIKTLMVDLKTKGVEVLMDVFESPVCQMASVKDSEGNSIILHQVHQN